MKSYKGSCHCGKVQFEVDADLSQVFECNCSMCLRKGTILTMVPTAQFRLTAGQDEMTTYHFYKKVIDHTFCKTCGITPFLTGKDRSGNIMKGVNVRCLEGVDLKTLAIALVDGRSF